MPNLWLPKTEPSTYSFVDLERESKAVWDDGGSNAAMKKGNLALMYHSGDEKTIIDLA